MDKVVMFQRGPWFMVDYTHSGFAAQEYFAGHGLQQIVSPERLGPIEAMRRIHQMHPNTAILWPEGEL